MLRVSVQTEASEKAVLAALLAVEGFKTVAKRVSAARANEGKLTSTHAVADAASAGEAASGHAPLLRAASKGENEGKDETFGLDLEARTILREIFGAVRAPGFM